MLTGVKGWFAHRDSARRDAADISRPDDLLPSLRRVVADRACCCPARPVVTAIMPPAPGRPHPVDLLLCGHHFRVSQAALTAVGAAVYDDTGALVAGADSEHDHGLREHASAALDPETWPLRQPGAATCRRRPDHLMPAGLPSRQPVR